MLEINDAIEGCYLSLNRLGHICFLLLVTVEVIIMI